MSLLHSKNDDNNNSVSIAEWVANAIADTGTRVVYGGHGGAIVPMVNAVCAHPLLEWVAARNEHDAAEMASAHAKLTGRLGVVIASSGPGATVSADSLQYMENRSKREREKDERLTLLY
jgi:acetolactate synthase I/II/III large subunit